MPIIKARSSSIQDSVDLRGTPTAPTALQNVNTSQLASTSYVRTAVADLINSSPALLDTLAELAAAINNDEAFSVTVANSIATKVPLDGSVAMTGNLTLSGAPVNNLHAVTKLYVDQAIDDQMIYSTDDVSEGQTNLYYTDARVRSAVSLASDNSSVLSYNSATGGFTYNHPSTDGILEGASNQYFTTARARNSISLTSDDGTIISYSAQTGEISFTTPDTDQIVEGQTNLYFTTARARASVNNGSNIAYDSGTGTISTQAAVWSVNGQEHDVVLDTDDVSEGSANLYFTNARVHSAVGLTTDDSNILSYNSATGTFTFVTPSTDAIDEGSVNLYYTDARVRAAISGSGDISYNQATGNFSYTTPTTDGVNEGSANLYFTTARARNSVSLNTDNSDVLSYDNVTGEFTFSLGSQTTDDVAEGTTNLYYTDTRARNAISTTGWQISYNDATGVITVATPDTDDVSEGTNNLYYTTARTRADVSATDAGGDGSFSYNSATGVFTYTGPSATEVRAHLSAVDSGGDGSFDYNSATGVFTYTGPTNTDYRNAVSAVDSGGDGSFEYNSATGVFTYTGPSAAEARAHFSVSDTGGDGSLEYNSSTGVFTYTGPSAAEVRAHLSVTDTGGDGSLSYNDTTGVFTYTGPSATEVRAHISASNISGDGSIAYNDATGVISYTGPSPSEVRAHLSVNDVSGDGSLSYNDATGVFTYTGPSATEVRAHLSVNDVSGDGSLSYNDSTGVFTYTGPSASEVRAHLSATTATGAQYDDVTGVISLSGIPNSSLTNDSVTVNGSTVALGGSTSFGTDSVTEETNLYYTDSRARSAVSLTTNKASVFDYNSTTGAFTFNLGNQNTDDVSEGSTNLYFTQTRARNSVSATDAGGDGSFSYDSATGAFTYTGPSAAEARAHFSVSDTGGDGSLSYDSATGTFTYTGPSASEVRAHLSATTATGAQYDSSTGVISLSGIPNSSLTNSDITLNGTTVSLGGSNSFTTDAVNEGTTNKYYTQARVRSELSANDVENSGSFSYSSTTGEFSFDATGVVAEVNGYKGYVTLDTDDIGEGSANLYYTTARTRADVSGGTGVTYTQGTGVFAIGQAVETTSDVTFNDVTVNGDLTVNGTLTTINSTDLTVTDKNITIADGAANAAAANGAGITVDGAGATITYASATDSWEFNKDVNVAGDVSMTGSLTAPTFVGDLTGDVTGTVSDISNHTTDALAEGGSNLYFTNGRAAGAISLTSDKTSVLSYNSGTGAFTFTIANASTSDIAEGTNLYFLNSRARNAISVTDNGGDGSLSYDSSSGVISYTGPSASEARAHFSATDAGGDGSFSYDSATGTFTYTGPSASEARAHFSATSATGVSYDNSTGVISLSGIPNSSLTNNSVTVNGATVALGGTTSFDTDSVDEGTGNLYFLDSRARDAISVTTSDSTVFDYDAATGVFTFSLGGLDTSEVTEDPNATVTSGTMYFTQARARNTVSATDAGGDGSFSYDSATGVFTYTGPSAAEAHAHFSAGTTGTGYGDLSYNSTTGAFTYDKVTSANIRSEFSAAQASGDGGFAYDFNTGTFTYTGPDDADYRLAISAANASGDGSIAYDDSTGVITYTGPSASETRAHFSVTDTGGDGSLTYSDATGVFTYTGPSAAEARAHFSATDAGGDGSFAYNDATGVFTYTGPSAAEARAHFSATKVSGDGAFSYNDSTGLFSYTGPDDADYRLAISATNVSGDGSIAYNDTTGVISYTGPSASETRAHFSATSNTGITYNSATGVFALASIPNSSLTNDSVTFNGVEVALGASGSFGTDAVAEDVNATVTSGTMYFTNARARDAISLTTNDSTVLDYDSTTGEFTFNLGGLDTSEIAEDPAATVDSGTMYFTNARARSAISTNGWQISYDSATGVISMATPDTDDVSEGATNLYFTNARARTAVSLTTDNTDAMSYDSTTGVFTFTLATVDTDEIAEGNTNLYFTTTRARNSVNNGSNIDYDAGTGTISTQAAVWSVNGQEHAVVLDTDDIGEGSTNLYFTDARARSSLTLTTDDNNILSYNSGTGALVWTTPTTDSIDEGSVNLYYTDTRADARIAAASIRDLSDVDSVETLQDGYTLVWSSVAGKFIPQNIAVQATTNNFTGDGTTLSFNTGVEVSSIDNTSVFINGLIQAPTYSYTLSTTNGETSIVFDTAPEANDYIFVRVIASASLNVAGVLNENSSVDGGSF